MVRSIHRTIVTVRNRSLQSQGTARYSMQVLQLRDHGSKPKSTFAWILGRNHRMTKSRIFMGVHQIHWELGDFWDQISKYPRLILVLNFHFEISTHELLTGMDVMLGMAMRQSLIKVAPFPLNHGLSELKSLAKTAVILATLSKDVESTRFRPLTLYDIRYLESVHK